MKDVVKNMLANKGVYTHRKLKTHTDSCGCVFESNPYYLSDQGMYLKKACSKHKKREYSEDLEII